MPDGLRVLVTGGSGFIGRHLIRALQQEKDVGLIVSTRRNGTLDWTLHGASQQSGQWWQLEEIACDLSEDWQVRRLMEVYRPEVIFHLAADPLIRNQGHELSALNVVGTHRLLEHCPDGCRFILASSAAVYGHHATDSFPAEDYQTPSPSAPYGATKVAAEALVQAYTTMGKIHGLSLRLVANVGVGLTHGLVHDILEKLESDKPELELIGDAPGSRKHYIHVLDTVRAFIHFGLRRWPSGVKAVNIANDDILSVAEVAETVMLSEDLHKPIRWLGEGANWKGDNRTVRVSNLLARSLGWKPLWPLSKAAIYAALTPDYWKHFSVELAG